MPLTVDDPVAEALARTLAERTGESVNEVVVKALRERLDRTPERQEGAERGDLVALWEECKSDPDYDLRSPDDIIGYDENGVPR